MLHKVFEPIARVFAGLARSWHHVSRPVRIIVLCATAAVVIAAIAMPVLLTLPAHETEQVAAGATPVSTPTPVPVATPVPTPVPTTPRESAQDITLQYGDQSEAVISLQNRLMKLGYLDLDEPTDYFGPATKSALQLFQRQHDMEQDGIATYPVQALLYSDEAEKYTIKLGTTGEDVKDVQYQLIDLGYLAPGNATGFYGDKTVEAVKKFQKANSLSADGLTGPATMELLYSPNAIATPERRNAVRSRANIDDMIAAAKSKLGKPYVSGAEGPNSFDCSGLVYWCLRQAGSNRGRYSAAGYSQVSDWDKITSMSSLQRGDLIFFWNSERTKIGHVAIYIGGGYMIDASSANGKVVKRSAFSSWCKNEFYCGRRPW